MTPSLEPHFANAGMTDGSSSMPCMRWFSRRRCNVWFSSWLEKKRLYLPQRHRESQARRLSYPLERNPTRRVKAVWHSSGACVGLRFANPTYVVRACCWTEAENYIVMICRTVWPDASLSKPSLI